MKTPIVIALSIAAVLVTGGAAMAVNAGTLNGFNQTHLGNAPTVLDPTASPSSEPGSDDDTSTATPEPSETAEPGDDNGGAGESGDDAGEHSAAPSPSHSESDDGGSGGDDSSGSDGSGGSGGHGSDD